MKCHTISVQTHATKPRRGKNPVTQKKFGAKGFALITTLTLMVLLLIVALGLLSLSTVTIRSSSHETDIRKARANARIALMVAISELQKSAGPDTRITATAEALAGVNGSRYVTGVWRSWEGLDHDKSTGLPKTPDYDSKLDTGESDPFSTDSGRFLGWLLSGSEKGNAADAPPSLAAGTDTVPLLSNGTLGSSATDKEVHLVPTPIGNDGAFAWWVAGENSKALMTATDDEPSEFSGWSQRLSSYGRPDSGEFGFDDPEQLATLVSRKTMDLASNSNSSTQSISGEKFHETTSFSRGLLTNVANGGWRRDLSLMSEQWSSLPSSNLPFFTLEPGNETSALKNSGAIGGLIYPWAQESNFDVENGSRIGGASVGWGALKDFALKYKGIASGSTTGAVTLTSKSGNGGRDEVPIRPILARIHWIFSFESVQSGTVYNANIEAIPVLTYWNPYNVSITGFQSFWLRLGQHFPYRFKFKVGDNEQSAFYPLYHQIGNATNVTLVMPTDTEVWQPGEARVYSPSKFNGPPQNRFAMQRGYLTPVAGVSQTLQKNGKRGAIMTGAANDSFTVTIDTISSSDFKLETLQWRGDITTSVAHSYLIPAGDVPLYWPPAAIQNTTQKLGTLSAGEPSPFLIAMFQLQNIYVKSIGSRGYSHNKPVTGILSTNISGKPVPTGHLDALPYDWVFRYPNGNAGIGTDGGLPVDGITSSDPYSLIGTSYRLEDGLKSLAVTEIPTRPLRSLGELQHFDVGFFSPMAPYIAEPIGNSNASFLIEPDKVFIDDSYTQAERVGYDHSYVANHLLFDDWFVSSIAPETNGVSSNEIRSVDEVYSDFVSGEEALPNSSYIPASPLPKSKADAAASELLADENAWHDVASKLEVDGMFNVNSTSVEAWTSLLKHLKDAQAPYFSNNTSTNSWSVALDSMNGHPVSRTTVAGDPAAGPADFYSAIGQHMRLTDTHIETLAVEIVEQVKRRGPFLSLSEFVNRKLTADVSETDLALAGAIETALTELSKRSSTENPYSELQATFPDDVAVPSGVNHAFPEAAEGSLAYGFPGWVRQADILRPLTPILSARDDTFVIRAYGESLDPATGRTKSSAWCEAVVQRRAEYLDPYADDSSVLPSDSTLGSEINKHFGRRFSIVSFRWLSPDEI